MKISYSQVEEYCNELHQIAQNMEEAVKNIQNSVNSMSKSTVWRGEVADYCTGFLKTPENTSLLESFDQVFREIENSILFMAYCTEGYKAIDENLKKEICQNLRVISPDVTKSSIIFRGGK